MSINSHSVELAQKILEAACRGENANRLDDIEEATIRSLSLLTIGNPDLFCSQCQPPWELQTWLREQASLSEVQGLLIETVRRWHELRKEKREKQKCDC